MSIAAILWRLIVLTVALIAEAAVIVVVGLYATTRMGEEIAAFAQVPPADAVHGLAYLGAVAFAALWAALNALTPWVIAVAVTEIMRWRGVLTHVLIGGLVALVAAVTSGAILVVPALQIIVALGLVGGFVHWLLVGRDAGRWSETIAPPSPPRMPGPTTWPKPPPPPSGPSLP